MRAGARPILLGTRERAGADDQAKTPAVRAMCGVRCSEQVRSVMDADCRAVAAGGQQPPAERQRALADEVGRTAAAALAKSKTAKQSCTRMARGQNRPVNRSGGSVSDLGK